MTDEKVIEEFNRKFRPVNFTWNGDNATGLKFAKKERAAVRKFILTTLKQYKEELVKAIKDDDIKTHICRFNDGEQKCGCYLAGQIKALEIIKK